MMHANRPDASNLLIYFIYYKKQPTDGIQKQADFW
jgi:hypothetical protein